MTANELNKMSFNKLSTLGANVINGMTEAELRKIDVAVLNNINEDEFIRLSVKVFECLSYKQFKRIYQNRIKSIPPRTAMKMTNKTFKKFKKAVFGK